MRATCFFVFLVCLAPLSIFEWRADADSRERPEVRVELARRWNFQLKKYEPVPQSSGEDFVIEKFQVGEMDGVGRVARWDILRSPEYSAAWNSRTREVVLINRASGSQWTLGHARFNWETGVAKEFIAEVTIIPVVDVKMDWHQHKLYRLCKTNEPRSWGLCRRTWGDVYFRQGLFEIHWDFSKVQWLRPFARLDHSENSAP